MICKCKNIMVETETGFFCESCYQYISKDIEEQQNLKPVIFGPIYVDEKMIEKIIKSFKCCGYRISKIDACLAYLYAMSHPIKNNDINTDYYKANDNVIFMWLKDYFYTEGGESL